MLGTKKVLKLIARAEAKTLGLTRYCTGKPCIHGHVAERMTKGGVCVACLKAVTAARYKNNPELRRAKEKRNRDRNPNRHREKNRRWIIESGYVRKREPPEIRRAKAKVQRDADPDKHRIKNRKWYEAHPEAASIRRANHRARKLKAEGAHTVADIERIFDKQRGRCANPKCRYKFQGDHTEDHIVPLVNGGSNWPDNIQLLCSPCNSSKGTKTMSEWLTSLLQQVPARA